MTASSIRFAGTGNAFHQDGRGSQSLLVAPSGDQPFLVDLGPTAIHAMERFAFDYSQVARLFVTHLHGDHTAGWPFLLLNLGLWRGRSEPLEVCGPPGVRDHLENLATTCYGKLLEPRQLGFEVRYRELEIREADRLVAGRGRFDVVPMEHHPSSIGYRFHLADATLAVTGDTRWCPGLERLAAGSDVLIIECTTRRPTDLSHVSLDELREKACGLGDCRVVLVHLTDEVAAALAADPIAGVVCAYDGMLLSLSADRPIDPL